MIKAWRELRRRRVIRTVFAYLVVAAAIGGVASDFLPGLGAPPWALSGVLAMLVTGIPIVAVAAWALELTPEGLRVTAPRGAHGTPAPSVAVLAFTNMSSDPDQDFFADGLSEEIINALARVDGLRVVGRTSAFAFKDKVEDLRVIGEKLGVKAILEGSVRRSTDRLRVTVQLVDATTGYQLFSESYDRRFGDVFEIQDHIAGAVTDKLCDVLPGQPRDRVALLRPRSTDPLAHEAYLRGMFFYWQYSTESAARALTCFQEALRRDPSYALAHAGAAIAHTWLAGFGGAAVDSTPDRARASAKRSLELDPDLPEGLNSLAEVLFWLDWDFDGARQTVLRAIQLSPSSAFAHVLYSFCLRVRGRFDEAVAELETALELDPLAVPIHNELGNAYLAAGRREQAEMQIARTLQLDSEFAPTIETQGWLHVRAGRFEEALKIFESLPHSRTSSLAARAYTLAALGRRDEARRLKTRLEALSQERQVTADVDIARVYAGLGDFDEAALHLERAVASKATPAILVGSSIRDWGRFRDDPRFTRLAERGGPSTLGAGAP